jgi:hypothetical protein
MRSPRISANKLGEYVVASPPRRRTIIRDQKNPPTYKDARYRQADEPVERFLLSGGRDEKVIDAAIVNLRSRVAASSWAREANESTAQALDRLLVMKSQLFADGLVYVAAPISPPKLRIGGVEVSVRPTVLVVDQKRLKIGAVRLHYTKTAESALDGEGGEYVATLLHQWTTKHTPRAGFAPSPQLSMCVDVFRKSIVRAPVSQTRRMDTLTAACEEIAARWPTIDEK